VEEERVMRLVHTFLCDLNLGDNERDKLVTVLRKEIALKHVVSRMYCLRTFDVVVRTDPKRHHSDLLYQVVRDVLDEYAKPDAIAEKVCNDLLLMSQLMSTFCLERIEVIAQCRSKR
jgi:hypothetical protein